MTIKAVDLSSWQAGFSFERAAREGVEAVIVKRCGGTSYKNPYFKNQIAGAQAAGMEISAYPYLLEPTGDPSGPEEEADYFCDALGDWTSPIWLDCEEGNSRYPDLNDYYLRYRQRVYDNLKIWPIGMYTGNYWVQQNGLFHPDLGKSPLWLASWQDSLPPVPRGGPWQKITMWQYDSRATYGGMRPIDINSFFGTREDWRALGKPSVPDVAFQIKESLQPIEYKEALPTGYEIHPYFWATWQLDRHGYPLGPAALYDDGRIRQLYERCVLGSNGRDEPIPFEGLGQAYHWATGRTIVDWPATHPLVSEGMR